MNVVLMIQNILADCLGKILVALLKSLGINNGNKFC